MTGLRRLPSGVVDHGLVRFKVFSDPRVDGLLSYLVIVRSLNFNHVLHLVEIAGRCHFVFGYNLGVATLRHWGFTTGYDVHPVLFQALLVVS